MGLLSFIKDAGEKLFGVGEAKAAQEAVDKAPTPENMQKMSDAAGDAIENYIRTMGLKVDNLDVAFDAKSATATVNGTVADQATREKVLLCCGNVANVAAVNDNLQVTNPEPEARFHTVQKGDTLSKIAKEVYGDAMKYPAIFEANKPMLTHPDKIYPGQVLRIPAEGAKA